MPKKFVGENSKAVAARARKSAAKETENAKRQQQLEEEYWKEDDKHALKKQQRKDEQERRKQQQQDKKAESKALYEQEMNTIPSSVKQHQPKVTRSQIQADTEKRNAVAAAAAAAAAKKSDTTYVQQSIEENVNRLIVDGVEARSVDEAIAVLSLKSDEIDRHPEKRVKAAYTAFEEANMPKLKAENPNLRLSQIKQLLRKEWMRSAENPLNQRLTVSK